MSFDKNIVSTETNTMNTEANEENNSKTRLVLNIEEEKTESNHSNNESYSSDTLDDYCSNCQLQRIEIAKYKAMVNLFEERDKNNKDVMNEYQYIISEYKLLSKKRKLQHNDDNPRRKKRRRKVKK